MLMALLVGKIFGKQAFIALIILAKKEFKIPWQKLMEEVTIL